MGLGECDCPEARLLRRLVEALDSPEGMVDRLASTLAVWKIRSASHEMSAANDWSRGALPWAKRQEYDTDARTAAEMHADVAASWERWYRARSTKWLTECAQHATDTGPHGILVRRILKERQ
jgi:hypothetical protein